MYGRSAKKSERILLVATLLVFLLLLFLKISPLNLFLSFPLEVPAAAEREYFLRGPFVNEASLREPSLTDPIPTTDPTAGEKCQTPDTEVLPQNTADEASSVETTSTAAGGGAPYALGKAQRRDLRVRLIVTNKGSTVSSNICMDVPLLGELDSPYQTVLRETFSHVPQEINIGALGNRMALFQINNLAPGKSETLILSYQLQSYPLKAELPALAAALPAAQVYYHYPAPAASAASTAPAAPTELTASASTVPTASIAPSALAAFLASTVPATPAVSPESPDPSSPSAPAVPSAPPACTVSYSSDPTLTGGQQKLDSGDWLKPGAKIESDHPEIIARAREVTAPAQGPLEKARLIFNYVKGYVRYDLSSPHRNKGALSALRTASGVCEDFATLFVALCRASGIPARQVNGYADPKGHGTTWQLAPAETLSLKGCRHSWAEFYLEGIGWLPADPTFNLHDNKLTYFTSLPQAGHLAQNYFDQPLRVRFQGGQLAVSWEEELAGL